ncbi:MAG: HEPN domain-containing protein [Candidatus Hydrothermarchaeota archaeon]
MKSEEMVKDYLFRAKRCLKEAETAFEEDDYPGAIRRAQESLELSVKGMLRYLGVEYPREHDVGDALEAIQTKLPNYIVDRIPDFKKYLLELARIRGPAFYGYEREGIPASKAFGREYANDILNAVRNLTSLCFRFLEG